MGTARGQHSPDNRTPLSCSDSRTFSSSDAGGDTSPSGTQAVVDQLHANDFKVRYRSEAYDRLDRKLIPKQPIGREGNTVAVYNRSPEKTRAM